MNSKRLNFIKSYLKLYDVQKIELTKETDKFIQGFAIYDESDPDEIQEFIWKKRESETSPQELIILIDRIVKEKMHSGDKLNKQIENIQFDEFDDEKRQKLLEELFEIEINMIDHGEETDSYFVHY
ncbi:hypothetical protein [Zunongwangia sp. H14]|uniref:hypothetical protein n=1 Tax=Zunongwangia sp. H14 TaxID=3240792 RepID=UPI003569FE10